MKPESTRKRGQRYNPRNPASPLYKSLTRLFSGPIVNRKRRLPTKRYRRDYSKFNFKSASGQAFQRSKYNPFTTLQANMLAEAGRMERYVDFEQMEFEPILAAALDTYADEMTVSSTFEEILNIQCRNEEIRAILHTLFYEILAIESNLHPWCRATCKYGDFFLYLDIEEGAGVKSCIALPVQEIERIEGEDESNPNYVVFQWNSGGITFENWQVCHFRLPSNDKYVPYGTSVLESARRIWRQLTLMEEYMMSYRMVRSSERRVFYVDVGGLSPDDIPQYIEKQVSLLHRQTVADPDSGRVDLRYNPRSVEEDIVVAMRGETGTKIDVLKGGQMTDSIEDVRYLQDKMFTAIRIPQSYLARTGDGGDDKQTLSQKDTRFAKIIQRHQLPIVEELTKIARIHLHTLGFKGEDLTCFDLSLNNPSKIAEMQELENWKVKFDAIASVPEGFLSKRFLAEKFLGMSSKEFERNQIELSYDAKFQARMDAIAELAAEGAAGSQGEEFSNFDGLGETMPEEEAEGDAEGDDDSVLLAEPPPAGKRDSDDYLTPGAKGKRYSPVDVDRRNIGARRRSRRSDYNYEFGSSARRNIYKGASLGRLLEQRDRDLEELEKRYEVIDPEPEVSVLAETTERLQAMRDRGLDTLEMDLPTDEDIARKMEELRSLL